MASACDSSRSAADFREQVRSTASQTPSLAPSPEELGAPVVLRRACPTWGSTPRRDWRAERLEGDGQPSHDTRAAHVEAFLTQSGSAASAPAARWLGRVLIKSGQMSALLRKQLNCCTFNGSALAANRCIGPPPTSYRRRRGWRRSEFVTARLSATNGRSLSRPRQRCRSRPGIHPSIFKTRRPEAAAGVGIFTGSSAMVGARAADAVPATNVLRSIVMPLLLLDLSIDVFAVTLWDCGVPAWWLRIGIRMQLLHRQQKSR